MNDLDKLVNALTEAWIVMNYTGDILNGRDMIEERDKAICNPSWEIIREAAPWLQKIDLDAEYCKRWQEVIGTCRDCGADVQWNEPYELLSGDKMLCMPCSYMATSKRSIEEGCKTDTATAQQTDVSLTPKSTVSGEKE